MYSPNDTGYSYTLGSNSSQEPTYRGMGMYDIKHSFPQNFPQLPESPDITITKGLPGYHQRIYFDFCLNYITIKGSIRWHGNRNIKYLPIQVSEQ